MKTLGKEKEGEDRSEMEATLIDFGRIQLKYLCVKLQKEDAMHICPSCGYDLDQRRPITFGNVTIGNEDEVFFEGQRIDLTWCQRSIITSLVHAQGRYLSYDALANRLGSDLNNNTIAVYVARTRASLRAIAPNFDQIKSVYGSGSYKWVRKPSKKSEIMRMEHPA